MTEQTVETRTTVDEGYELTAQPIPSETAQSHSDLVPLQDNSALTPCERLLELHNRQVFFVPSLSKSGAVRGISQSKLLQFYTTPLEHLLRPFSHSFYLDETKETKEKYECYIISLVDNHLTIKVVPENGTLPVVYATLSYSPQTNRWNVNCYQDEYLSDPVENPYTARQWQSLNLKALKHAQNLPLIRMYAQGKVSKANFVAIIRAYTHHHLTKELIRADGTRIPFTNEIHNFIAAILVSQLKSDSTAEIYTLSDYLKNFIRFNWSLIKNAVDMAQNKVLEPADTETLPLSMFDLSADDTL